MRRRQRERRMTCGKWLNSVDRYRLVNTECSGSGFRFKANRVSSRVDAVQGRKSLVRNRGRYPHVAKFRCVALTVLQTPTEEVPHRFGGFSVLIVLAQQYPGKGHDWIRIPPLGSETKTRRLAGISAAAKAAWQLSSDGFTNLPSLFSRAALAKPILRANS